jgi:hypothetical protein
MSHHNVLLLTATVAPSTATPDLKIQDPRERETNYLDSLSQWCKALPSNWQIVVAENSGWPAERLSDVGERFDRSVHVLTCPDRGSDAGKGVGEAGLLDDFAASKPAHECDWIFKCTGRLFVHNTQACLPPLVAEGVCGSIVPSLDHMDSRFFGTSKQVFHEYFLNMGSEIRENEGLFFEHIAARRLMASLSNGNSFLPFRRLPYFIGRSASIDAPYHGAQVRVKGYLRERVRQIVLDRQILI